MLTRLSIRNVVLIEALDLDFGRGLGVLTGETGAGKSILLDALGLVLGNRAETMLVRAGEERASVSASFEFAALPEAVAEALDEAGIALEPGEPLLIRRQVRADGGSKAFINDQPASAGLLRTIAPALVELHGQHDDRGLVNPRGHRALLDRYAGADTAGVAAAWDTWRGAEARLAAAHEAIEQARADQDLLLAHLAELTTLEPQAGEAEEKLMAAAEALVHDPAALDAAETRLFELRAIARKHRCEVDELPDKMREFRSALDKIEGGEAELDALEEAAKAAGARYRERAGKLHAARVAAAKRLDAAVAGELAPLKLDDARFLTAVGKLPEERWGAAGMDSVEFLIATNPGADFAPLNKIASGGELSRFILALKVALAEQGGAATVIFDEIDRGVGGAVASAIGVRLARLADGGQLLAVTHSPQVAAKGRTHYLIAKSSEGTVTKTSVALLDDAGRQEEIARMLSGAEVTPEARAQADRLLEGV